MAYRLKSNGYKGKEYKILLQNENGPCPLLAAANALILRGSIRLPPECERTGVATIEQVVNVLAERALESHNHQQYHLNDFMSIVPSLQYGMDVNPKFTSGVTGVEYTTNLNAFDMLGVDLVHGWLLDPSEFEEALPFVGPKSYNELVEDVILGNEASSEVEVLSRDIRKLGEQLNGEEWVELSSKDIPSHEPKSEEKLTGELLTLMSSSSSLPLPENPDNSAQTVEEAEEKKDATNSLQDFENIQHKVRELRTKQTQLSQKATRGHLINAFLTATSHQLTQFGLQELYSYVKDGELCVFFRNNHFSTLTKHDGTLYTLVTDLGYANVPQVMWEKLDVIDGDTEYVNAAFQKLAPQKELVATASLSGEAFLAQQGQAEADFQLALQLSQQELEVNGISTPAATAGGSSAAASPNPPPSADLEGVALEAAKEASLLDYRSGAATVPTHIPLDPSIGVGTIIDLPPESESLSETLADKHLQQQKQTNLGGKTITAGALAEPAPNAKHSPQLTQNTSSMPTKRPATLAIQPQVPAQPSAMEDQDRYIALQLQAEMEAHTRDEESAALARRLFEQESDRLAQLQQTGQRPTTKRGNSRSKATGSNNNSSNKEDKPNGILSWMVPYFLKKH